MPSGALREERADPLAPKGDVEIVELESRLNSALQEIERLKDALKQAAIEKERFLQESEGRLQSQSLLYEERLTELHSVIAELSRKQRHDTIFEEDEDEEDGGSFRLEELHTEDSISEAGKTLTDFSTSCEIDDRAVEAGEGIADLDVNDCKRVSEENSSWKDPPTNQLEEDLKNLMEENSRLKKGLALQQSNASTQRTVILALTQERNNLRKKLQEYSKMQPPRPPSSLAVSDAVTVKGLRGSPIPPSIGDSAVHLLSPRNEELETPSSGEDPPVICRMAEKVRLKKAESGDLRVTSTELNSIEVWTAGIAEQLISDVQEESAAQELFHSLATAGGSLYPHERLREYEVEVERLRAKADHLKSQNDVLAVTLTESKAHCDHLTMLMGQYESHVTSLQMIVTNLERTLEAFEVLTSLLESEIALLVSSCRAAGIGIKAKGDLWAGMTNEDILICVKRAQDQKRSTENVARHFLSRIEDDQCSYPGQKTTKSSVTSGIESDDGQGVESLLRSIIDSLKVERLKFNITMMPLQSLFSQPLPAHYPLSFSDAQKLDLENAVLMQELMSIREDRAELRAQLYLMEREKLGTELRLNTCEAQVGAYSAMVNHLQTEINRFKLNEEMEEPTSEEGSKDICKGLHQDQNEKQLSSHVHELLAALEKVSRNAELKHLQSQEFISDLKKSNGALLTAVDRLKKKYGQKMKKTEQQVTILTERHNVQVRILNERIAELEKDLREAGDGFKDSSSSETPL